MGGEIWVESQEGTGSIFTFTACCQPALRPAAEPAGEPGTARAPAATGGRILVAEDNLVNQRLMLRILERHGYRAHLAATGTEVLEILAGEPIDLVLMDVQMPEMDGYEATRRIRSGAVPGIDPALPVIALTACALPADEERCRAAGMNDYLAKPVDGRQLLALLGRMLAGQGERGGPRLLQAEGDATLLAASAVAARFQCDAGFVQELWEIFREEAPDQVRLLQQALADGETVLAQRLAHSLRGGAGNIGANRLQQAAAELERTLPQAGGGAEAVRLCSRVAEELAAVLPLLETHLAVKNAGNGGWCRVVDL
jgi:CheY-like chemotaxis protein